MASKFFVIAVILFFLFLKTVFAQANSLVISEIMYDPAGSDDKHEWVEIQNTGAEKVPIVGGSSSSAWRFYDGSNHTLTFFGGASVLEPGAFLILADDPATFIADHPGFNGTIYKSSLSLNNDADTLKLSIDGGNIWLGEISYTKDLGASGNNYSLEKDGGNLRQSYILGGTPGRANSTQADKPVYSRDIILNEILPQPSTGTNDEFIELKNIGQSEIDFAGWQLDDIAGGGSSAHIISASRDGGTKISPGGFLVFYKPETGLALNDGGDDVRLVTPGGEEREKISYPKATKGQSYAKNESGAWAWNSSPSPGKINVSTAVSVSSPESSSSQNSQAQSATSSSPTNSASSDSSEPSFSSSAVSTFSPSTAVQNIEEPSPTLNQKKSKTKKSSPSAKPQNKDTEKAENEELAKKLTGEVKGIKDTAEPKSLFSPFKNSVKFAIGASILFFILLILEGMLKWQREKSKTKK